MKKAFVFPGQGAQFVGMGKDLYENSPEAKELFEKANEILGFRITDLMFEGTDEDLKQTKVTQPAIFLHSVILAKSLKEKPDMVAGHSLGEFSALVANGTLSFEDGLRLVHARALAMQKACEANPSTMAAILGLPDETVENILAEIDDVVVPANYNCPGQIVITGEEAAVAAAGEQCKESGAKRVVPLKVSGPFHSPMLKEAGEKLGEALAAVTLREIKLPYLENVTADYVRETEAVKPLLKQQVCAPVRWQQSVERLLADGVDTFVEIGPGHTLSGFMKKILKQAKVRADTVQVYNVENMDDFKEYMSK